MTEQLYFGANGVTLTGNAQVDAQRLNAFYGQSNEEEELVMPGLVTQVRHPLQEEIEMEEFSEQELQDFVLALNEFGRDRFMAALHDARGGLVTNSVSDLMLFVNAEGGLDVVKMFLGALTPALWEEANRAKPLPATPERSALIDSIVANSANAPEAWSAEELAPLETPALHKLNNFYIPKDYSGNGGVIRNQAAGGEEEELQINWGNFFDRAPSSGQSSYESPNNILRRLSRESQNGNGFHPS